MREGERNFHFPSFDWIFLFSFSCRFFTPSGSSPTTLVSLCYFSKTLSDESNRPGITLRKFMFFSLSLNSLVGLQRNNVLCRTLTLKSTCRSQAGNKKKGRIIWWGSELFSLFVVVVVRAWAIKASTTPTQKQNWYSFYFSLFSLALFCCCCCPVIVSLVSLTFFNFLGFFFISLLSFVLVFAGFCFGQFPYLLHWIQFPSLVWFLFLFIDCVDASIWLVFAGITTGRSKRTGSNIFQLFLLICIRFEPLELNSSPNSILYYTRFFFYRN